MSKQQVLFDRFFATNADDIVADNLRNEIIKEIVKTLEKWNTAYRTGKALVTDKVYDAHIDTLRVLDPDNKFLKKVGYTIKDARTEELPIPMASMDKIKTIQELHKWAISKHISMDTMMISTPKFDGLSFLNDVLTESDAWTRGDGMNGQKSNEHFKAITKKYGQINTSELNKYSKNIFTVGEIIIHKNIFAKRHSQFANIRNRVAGLLNDFKQENIPALNDCLYMRYGLITDKEIDKKNQLDILNEYFNGINPCKYHMCKLSELTEELLEDLFNEWSKPFNIDGIIIEVNDAKLRAQIKPETSTLNPGFARAYKSPTFEQSGATPVNDIKYEVSKLGYVIPVAHVDPISLDGATVTKATVNNARQVLDMKLGIGSIVKIKRSGMVIPLITEVVKSVNPILPTNCPSCGTKLIWSDSNTHLMCTNDNCTDKRIKIISAFFDILEVDGMRETTCRILYENGFDSIEKILLVNQDNLKTLPKFGDSKAENLYNAIRDKVNDVELSKLQHASGMFPGLGSKKLKLLEGFSKKPTIREVVEKIDGFSDTTATVYVENYDRFFAWAFMLPVTIKYSKARQTGKFSKDTFVFTGCRADNDLATKIENLGGVIEDGISKSTTYLVMKVKGSGSGKEIKAAKMGIKIITLGEMKEMV